MAAWTGRRFGIRRGTGVLLCLLVAACGPAVGVVAVGGPGTTLDALIEQNTEQTVDQNLATPASVPFPARVGLLTYNLNGALKDEDREAALIDLKTKLLAKSALVANVVILPDSSIPSGSTGSSTSSLDNMRKFASSFGCDTLVVLSATTSFEQASSLSVGLFDSWAGKSYWESRSSLSALAINVATGRYLAPFKSVGHAGPDLVVPSDTSSAGAAYGVKKKAELAAWADLDGQILAAFQGAHDAQKPVPMASAPPAGLPSVAPSAPAPAASASVAP